MSTERKDLKKDWTLISTGFCLVQLISGIHVGPSMPDAALVNYHPLNIYRISSLTIETKDKVFARALSASKPASVVVTHGSTA
ncbi:hypothetical protein [Candidatus Vondammii sp. HM_W22]|uniref:hypothetical protein n=1 Tax=Candidatus Vondammii sp. HM_W22 TaxID=2687299 RepID=UPI001F149568|nr:hypothetical protein [Candidatus Vondammii sp. HM_W22]